MAVVFCCHLCVTAFLRSVPTVCPYGSYCPAGAYAPNPCPFGYICDAAGLSAPVASASHFVQYGGVTHAGDAVTPLGASHNFLSASTAELVAACQVVPSCAAVSDVNGSGTMTSVASPTTAAPSSSSLFLKRSGTVCEAGSFLVSTFVRFSYFGTQSSAVCRPCAPGRFGTADGASVYNSTFCGGPCACSGGTYCQEGSGGSSTSACAACPGGRWCGGGSAIPGAVTHPWEL